jgi:hypothetical protein
MHDVLLDVLSLLLPYKGNGSNVTWQHGVFHIHRHYHYPACAVNPTMLLQHDQHAELLDLNLFCFSALSSAWRDWLCGHRFFSPTSGCL